MNPFQSIWEDVPQPKPVIRVTVKPRVAKPDHTEAQAIYDLYLLRKAKLDTLREYAKRVVFETRGVCMTPVMPLATMNQGRALLCDHCGKPMILEGGAYNKVPVDQAWARNPDPTWRSFIKGGCMIEIVENGTLRVYHGYPGMIEHCCNIAKAARDAAAESHRIDLHKANLLARFLETRDPNASALLSGIVSVMLSFDPGYGVNQP